jgi:biopolymer transport protein ExbD
MIPLIDVMLVLLVIFIVTAPLLTHAVKVDLPKASTPNLTSPTTCSSRSTAKVRFWWNGERSMPQRWTRTPARRRRALAAARTAPARRAHHAYEKVAEVMSAAAREGLTRIGFVTEPTRNAAR